MSFGASGDLWGLADTNVALISTSIGEGHAEAQALDEYGDVDAVTLYDSLTTRSATYRATSDTPFVLYDTTSAVDYRMGAVKNSYVITGIDITTSNVNRPEITISGQTCASADGDVEKYSVNDLEISGARTATALGFTADSATNILGVSISASVNIARELDSAGAESTTDVYGGRIETTTDMVGVTAGVSGTADTNWTLTTGPSNESTNTEYETGTATVFKTISKDT